MSPNRPDLRTALRGAGAFAVLLALGLLLRSVFWAPEVPFLIGGPGTWIQAPRAVDTQLVAVAEGGAPAHVFVRRFDAKAGEPATLALRALTEFEAELNGRSLPLRGDDPVQGGESWRSTRRFDLGPGLRDGRNELRVRVRNPKGPPLLQARIVFADRTLTSDAEWRVIPPDANPVQAARADDTRLHPDSFLLPEPGQVMLQHAVPLGLGLAACFALVAAVQRLRPAWFVHQRLAMAAAFALVFWMGVFAFKSASLPAVMGFDAPAHMHYIELIRSQARLPLAAEGFQTYHPPLYHVLTAALVWASGASPESASASVAYRIVSTLSGFACVVFAGLTARRLWPDDDARVATATLFAAVLPVGVYTAAYLGNESFHAACASGALFFATRICTAPQTRTRDVVWLGACLSMALLTKFTSLALAPVIVGCVMAKRFWLEDTATATEGAAASTGPGRRALVTGAALAGGVAVASGWFYLRNLLVYGDPVVWNLDVPGAPTWWLQPGFHTPAWLLSFGEGVRHPLFAGFHSLWDGVYSTFWGDGLVAGMASASTRHRAWNEPLMWIGYWLAMPAVVPLAYGVVRALRVTIGRDARPRGRELARALLLAVAFVLATSMLLISLRLPFYAQAKASYLLAGLVPVVVLGADGLVGLTERLPAGLARAGSVLIWGWALALGAVLAGSLLG